MINKKFIDFENNDRIQEDVNKLFCNIFNNKKKDALNIAANVINNPSETLGY